MGILSSVMSASDTLLRIFTMALRLFPCATTRTFLPDFMVGTMVSFQYGRTLSIVVFKLLVKNGLPQL